MERMQISLISVVPRDGIVVARAKATAPAAGSRIWIEVVFEPSDSEPWGEAYDRVLAVLDPA